MLPAKFRSPSFFIPALSLLFLIIAAVIVYLHFNRHYSSDQIKTWEQAFLRHRYGKFDKKHQAWRGGKTDRDGVPQFWMHVCAEDQVSIKGEPHLMLALCGEQGHGEGAHVEGGRHDFYVLKPDADGGQLVPAAQRVSYLAGSFGHPAEVNTVRLGRDFYGFELNDTWVGQGQTIATRTLVIPHSKSLVISASFRAQLGLTGNEICGTGNTDGSDTDSASADNASPDSSSDTTCVNLTFDMTLDDSQPDLPVYPISVHETGTDHQTTVDHVYPLRFIASKGIYQVPQELSRTE